MSETRHYRGKIVKIASGYKEMEAKAKEILQNAGKTEIPSYYDSWTEHLEDYYYRGYVRIDNDLYAVEKDEVGGEDVFIAVRTDEGYEFEVAYYDGGMSFDEAIQEAVDNAKRKATA